MLGYTLAYAVNFAAFNVGIKDDISALRADQIKGRFVALKDVGFSLDIVFRHNSAVPIYIVVALEPIARGHGSGSI
jgi:hypothetical protein